MNNSIKAGFVKLLIRAGLTGAMAAGCKFAFTVASGVGATIISVGEQTATYTTMTANALRLLAFLESAK